MMPSNPTQTEPTGDFKDFMGRVVPKIAFHRIGFFSSHGGSSMRGIVEACGTAINATPALVISNNPESPALAFAEARGLTALALNVKRCGSPEEVTRRMLEELDRHQVDLIVLSGYMKIIDPAITAQYAGRIFNIHPALLPKFGGHGMWGLHVHEAVIKAGESESGITIHEVNDHYDEGQIIAQMKVPVLPGDTAHTLAERVKHEEPPFWVRTLVQMQRP